MFSFNLIKKAALRKYVKKFVPLNFDFSTQRSYLEATLLLEFFIFSTPTLLFGPTLLFVNREWVVGTK